MDTLLQLEPGNRDYLKLYPSACVGLGDYEPGIRLYRQMLAQGAATGTETADLHLWLADLLKTVGRQPEAVHAHHAAIAAWPSSGKAWWSVRRLLDFYGLPFEPACLDFHKTPRNVCTASSEQVRQPISREGIDQWRNFEPWLGSLRAALGDAVTSYRD